MEANICEENVSLSAANVIDEKASDNIDQPEAESRESSSNVKVNDNHNDTVSPIVEHCAENETEQIVANSDDKSQDGDNNLSNNEDNDYYEVVSADGSVGGDDVDTHTAANDIGFGAPDEDNLTNSGFATVTSSVDRPRSEQRSFIDLPFVPKFEFPLDSSESENVSNYGAFHVNRFISDIPRPDKNFTIPPPNYRPLLDINPSFDSVHGAIFNPPPPVHNPTFFATDEIVSAASDKPCDIASSSIQVLNKKLKKRSRPLKKDPVVDWVDENGDPLPGAFDYVKPNEERDLSEENTRVEYVFSVKEKKDVPLDSSKSCVLNSGFLIGHNVLHKNVAGNLGVPLGLSLDPAGTVKNVDEDEEKKLYEASKSGPEYKAAVQVVTASSSTTNASVSKIVPGDDKSKKDQRPRFRRNRFTDIKKEDDQHDEPAEAKPQKSAEEAALENQAITEILKEVQRGAARAREVGALGWQKCPIPVTNKTFLRNTLVSTLREPYRPPSRFDKFNTGFKKNDDGGSYHKSRDDDRSSSSRSSRSRSSSRSHSSSYSRSVSGSSYTDDDHSGSRGKGKHFSGRGRGSWNRGQHEYYDDAWAAYAAHYGYPWYNPDALPMFYGPEGWPMDPYAAMYYSDPQAWMEYAAYYGTSGFGSRRMGRGFRGRGRGFRGRGRGGYEGDFRGYNIGAGSSREYSQPHSRSGRSRSWSRDLSRSRSRSRAGSGERRSQSHSTSQDRTHQSKRRARSRGGSNGHSAEKTASDAETSEKKKKKKKKKKKHKKLKKSKHRQKGEDSDIGDKNAVGSVDAIAIGISNVNDDKEKPEDGRVETDDLVKKRDVAKLEKGKEYSKYTGGGKGEKEDTKKIKEKKYDSKVRENVSEKGDKVRSKGDSKIVTEQLGSSKNDVGSSKNDVGSSKTDEHDVHAREDHEKDTRKQKEKTLVNRRSGENKYQESSSQDAERKSKNEDLRSTKLEDKTSGSHEAVSNSKSRFDKKGDRTNDNEVNVKRDKMYVDSNSRMGSYVKQDVINRQKRFDSSRFEKESILSVGKYKFGVDKDNFMYDKRDRSKNEEQRDSSGANVEKKCGSRERKCENVYSHGRSGSQGRVSQDGSKYHKGRDETRSDSSESCDSGHSGRRKSRGSHTYKQNKEAAGINRSESNDSTRKSKMVDSYKARKEITLSGERGEIHNDGKRPRGEDCRDGRSVRHDHRRSGSYDKREGYVQNIGREIQGENRSHSRDGQEKVRKIDCGYKDGRGESSLVTKVSRKLDNSIIRQPGKSGGNKYNENDTRSDITQREEKSSDNKERSTFASKERILQTDNREESCEKKIAGLNKDIRCKRQRSASMDRNKVDENLDKVQTARKINVTAVGNQRQRSRNDSEKEENKKCEDRGDLEGKQKEKRVKSDKKRIQSDEMHSVDKETKEGVKKHRERKNDDRRKEEKETALEYGDGKILHLNTTQGKIQESCELHEENVSPEKLKHKKVIKLTQVSKNSTNATDNELKNKSSSRDSNEGNDVHAMKKRPGGIDRGGAVNKDETEENTDKRAKDDGKGVKRKRKIIKKVGAKKIKTSSVGEATGGEKVITDCGGDTGEILKKQLQYENTLNKESEKITVENSHDMD